MVRRFNDDINPFWWCGCGSEKPYSPPKKEFPWRELTRGALVAALLVNTVIVTDTSGPEQGLLFVVLGMGLFSLSYLRNDG
ncbi:MAG: hypothetical protein D6698_16505 [Gammaproteobacteria bacterium]|nr:MAG: hypothetical protein D6698_16505 [Gammaproteobacteria bacterium]